jgi:hypothetical protein
MMANLMAIVFFSIILVEINSLSTRDDGCFRASVYEHIQQGRIFNITDPSKVIDTNLRVYEEIIKLAAEKVC